MCACIKVESDNIAYIDDVAYFRFTGRLKLRDAGKRFLAVHGGRKMPGKVQFDPKYQEFYLCSDYDTFNGSNCDDKLGYKYSYCIGNGTLPALDRFYIEPSDWDSEGN